MGQVHMLQDIASVTCNSSWLCSSLFTNPQFKNIANKKKKLKKCDINQKYIIFKRTWIKN